MNGSQKAIRTLACLLNDLLSFVLSLEKGLNVLGLTGLRVELNHPPSNVRYGMITMNLQQLLGRRGGGVT